MVLGLPGLTFCCHKPNFPRAEWPPPSFQEAVIIVPAKNARSMGRLGVFSRSTSGSFPNAESNSKHISISGGRHKKACCRPSILAVTFISSLLQSLLLIDSYKNHLYGNLTHTGKNPASFLKKKVTTWG